MREYDDETLHKVQQIELMILRDAVNLCKKYDIHFFGIAGTAIGALRHQGFIPWDDDIDVAFLRTDYDAFVKHVKEDLSDKYIVMNAEEDSNYPLMTTRLMLKDTKFREEALQNIDCFFGVFLDIYVLDNLPDDETLFKKHCRQAFIISKLQILRSIAFPVLPYHGMKAKLTHIATGIAHGILVVFGSKKRIVRRAEKIAAEYNDLSSSKRVGFLFDTYPEMNLYERAGIFPLKQVKFNGIDFSLPGNIDQKLRDTYGDYMQLPPMEQRKNHYPFELDFGRYDKYSPEEIASGICDAKI